MRFSDGFADRNAADGANRSVKSTKYDYGNETVTYGPNEVGRRPSGPGTPSTARDGDYPPALGVPRRRDDGEDSEWSQQPGRKRMKGRGGFAVRGRGGALLKKQQTRKPDAPDQRNDRDLKGDTMREMYPEKLPPPLPSRPQQQQQQRQQREYSQGTIPPYTATASSAPGKDSAPASAPALDETESPDSSANATKGKGSAIKKIPRKSTYTSPFASDVPRSMKRPPADKNPTATASSFASGANRANNRPTSGPNGRRMVYGDGSEKKLSDKAKENLETEMVGSVTKQEVGISVLGRDGGRFAVGWSGVGCVA